MPRQLTEAELREALQQIISETGASAVSDLGKVMGVATKQLAGKANGKTISNLVKQMLTS